MRKTSSENVLWTIITRQTFTFIMEAIWVQLGEASCIWKCTNSRWPEITENLKSMYYTIAKVQGDISSCY